MQRGQAREGALQVRECYSPTAGGLAAEGHRGPHQGPGLHSDLVWAASCWDDCFLKKQLSYAAVLDNAISSCHGTYSVQGT